MSHRLVLILVTICIATGCRLNPDPFPSTRSGDRFKVDLLVTSDDPAAALVFCRQLKTTESFRSVNCQENKSLPAELTELHIQTRIEHSSSDFWRNTKLSLASLTTLMLVTTSAEVTYNIRFRKKGADLKQFSLKSRGRIGVWGIQPPVTAYIGMAVGTVLNVDKLPDRLHAECTGTAIPKKALSNRNCQAYQRFIQDSLSQVWAEYMIHQEQLLSMSRPAPGTGSLPQNRSAALN